MTIFMKRTYVLEIEIQEGSDEWWEEIAKRRSTGCDEIVGEVRELLTNAGFLAPDCTVRLTKFEYKG